ncbi:MAG TPA: V-type ATP synthase subunit D [Candidatus Lokiarchaeia archaeon]|nr:V-type ATP synthase subunit D [Candidatus Lokiarchaeia archaeon]
MARFVKLVPTKSELIRLRRRLKFLQKGHELLQLKADSLLIQIKNFYKNIRENRKVIFDNIIKAFLNLKAAETISGEYSLQNLSDVNRNMIEYVINIGYKSSMGFTVPQITFHIEREKHYPHYGFFGTNIFLDQYYQLMQKAIEDLLKLAELESTLFIMAMEYKKLRRRINALENIIIPQTEEQIKLIDDILNENAQEEFIRLKKIKSKILIKKEMAQ